MSPPTMASCSNRSAAAGRKNLRVLLRCTRDTLRIPDQLAAEIGAEEAFFVSPFGNGRVRPVEVGRDGDGEFLGRGWPEFAGACGVGAGWLLVLRHHGGGVLTVKAFDVSRCLRELAARPPAVEEPMSSTDASRRPQFISVLSPNAMEKMLIPANFVQNYFSKGHMKSHIAILIGPLGKICQAELEMSGSDTFFAGVWSEFLALHGITEDDCLLLRYEGNMTFTVKVFGPNGCQIEPKHNGVRMQQISTLLDFEKQQELPSASIQKCERKKDRLCNEERKKPKASMTSPKKPPLHKRSFYEIGPPSWIKKVINTSTLKHHLVHGRTSVNSSYMISHGWKKFCLENSLKEGDMCIFYVVETTLWHVVIVRCKEKQETTPAASSKCKSDDYISSSEEQKGRNGPMTSLNKASSKRKCSFGIGPPAWMKKEINTSTMNVFSLPLAFCEALGLREPCTITLKTSMSSTMSWQTRVMPYKHCNHLGGKGWKRFCQENRVKEGDVCTFNVVDTKLSHVVITHQ